jgi:hypothetical protein
MMRSAVRFGSVLFLAWCMTGCAKKPVQITGQVTYEGAPVQSGYISFIPVEGTGASSGGPIKGGRYKVEDVPPGLKRVEIRAGAEVAAMPDMVAPKPKADGKGAAAKAS